MVLTNSGGHPTSLTIQWDSQWTDNSGCATDTPDGKLMYGQLNSPGRDGATVNPSPLGNSVYNSASTNKPLAYIGNIGSWWHAITNAEGYAVVIYNSSSHNPYGSAESYVESVSGSPFTNTMVEGTDLTPHYFSSLNSSSVYSGTYVQATGTNSGSATSGANYVFLTGLTNDAILIRSEQRGYFGGMNGFQLVPVYPTAPTATAPTFSPSSPVYSGVPVTVAEAATGDAVNTALYYQWLTDGGSGGALTNMPNATNSTVTVTPASMGASSYNIQFQVIVTNFMGSVTSSVSTLTVNPGAPVVNHDTSPSGNVYAYANGSVTFTANFNGSQPLTNQWATTSSYPLTGATNTTLNLTNLQLSVDDGTYQLLVTNALGNNASSAATLTVLADPAAPDASTAYPYDVFTNGPVAYWRFNETIDSTTGNSVQAYDYSGHNFNATYGNNAYDLQSGPSPSSYPACPGFESGNTCVTLLNGTANSWLDAAFLELEHQRRDHHGMDQPEPGRRRLLGVVNVAGNQRRRCRPRVWQ